MGDARETERLKEATKDLLLEDYRYRAQSLWKSEEGGETRVQLFAGFAAAVAAGLGVLMKDGGLSGDPLRLLVLGSLFSLLVLGWITMARMLIRNEHTDKCKRGLDAIRQVFKDHFDNDGALVHYYPIGNPSVGSGPKSKEAEKGGSNQNGWWQQYKNDIQPRKFGGLVHTAAAINGLIVGAMVGFAIYPSVSPRVAGLRTIFFYTLLAAAIAFLAQVLYIAAREVRAKKKAREGGTSHAGGVVFRQGNSDIEYLLVKAKKDSGHWVLPKGHIEEGEGHGEAALREVREETGVVAGLLGLAATNIEFDTEKERVNAKFYLMERLFEGKAREKREIGWFGLNEALELLGFEESKHALRSAAKMRTAILGREGQARLETKRVSAARDYAAPDGSEIRLLPVGNGGGLCHCTLGAGRISRAVSHRTVEEIWYFLSGQGQVWRKLREHEEVIDVDPGMSLTIPVGAHFQFRNIGQEPLSFIIVTMPPWPGRDEAVQAQGPW